MQQGYLMTTQWSDEDAGYIATCDDFPGLSAFGESEVEAILQGYVALGLFVDTCMAHGDILPEPHKYER